MSDWQVDEHGRYYRIGAFGEIEYRMRVKTSTGSRWEDETISAEQIEKERQQRLQAIQTKTAEKTGKICPYKKLKGISFQCMTTCALYSDGCQLRRAEAIPNTLNRNCPIAGGICDSRCAMYDGGCRFNG